MIYVVFTRVSPFYKEEITKGVPYLCVHANLTPYEDIPSKDEGFYVIGNNKLPLGSFADWFNNTGNWAWGFQYFGVQEVTEEDLKELV